MNLKRTIDTIVLSLAVAAIAVGCAPNNTEYKFDGQIYNEQVVFGESGLTYNENWIKVTKPDGNTITYTDKDDDLVVDHLRICHLEDKIIDTARCVDYSVESENPELANIFSDAQSQFDWYLSEIMKINVAPLYDIKGRGEYMQ